MVQANRSSVTALEQGSALALETLGGKPWFSLFYLPLPESGPQDWTFYFRILVKTCVSRLGAMGGESPIREQRLLLALQVTRGHQDERQTQSQLERTESTTAKRRRPEVTETPPARRVIQPL